MFFINFLVVPGCHPRTLYRHYCDMPAILSHHVPTCVAFENVYKTKAPLSKESIQKALTEIIKDKTQNDF